MFETFLFVLTLVKFYQSVARNFGKHSILYIFVRDGTWAFALIFGMFCHPILGRAHLMFPPVAMLLNMLMYKLANSPLVGMGYLCVFVIFTLTFD